MSQIFVVVCDAPDSYDVGTHISPLEAFGDRESAQRLIDGLWGKPKHPHSPVVWGPWDSLAIEEWEVR